MPNGKNCCILDCLRSSQTYHLHAFPHPTYEKDRFLAWVEAVRPSVLSLDHEAIYKRCRVCHEHFEIKYYTWSRHLSANAVPTLFLPGLKGSAETVEQKGEIHNDHTYVVPYGSEDTLHVFPNPARDQNRFNSWVYAVGGGILGLTNDHILKYRRVCHRHFEEKYVCANNYLSNIAIPTKYLSDNVVKFVSNNESLRPVRNVATPGESTSKENRVTPTPQYVNTKPKYLHEIKPSTKIDLAPAPPEETQTLSDIDELLAGDFVTYEYDVPVPDRDPSPVPEVEDTAENNVYSWQKTELIEADDLDSPPVPPPPPAAASLALTCESDQAVPTQPAPAEKDVENRCKDCAEVNEGFSFWCVECCGGALCGACAGRPPHHRHHVLRAPRHADTNQTQAVLMVIRQQLRNENLLSQNETLDDGVKLEVKEEPREPPPAEPDPLACEPHGNQCIAELIADHPQPLKLPQLPEAHVKLGTQRKLFKVSPAQVKRKFLFHLEKIVTTQQQVKGLQTTFPACKENLVTQPSKVREYQGLKSISQTTGNLDTTRQNQVRTQAHVERIVTRQLQVKGPQTTSQACKENLVTQPSKVREYQGLKSISQTTGNLDTTRQNQVRTQAHVERIVTRQLQVKGPQTTSQACKENLVTQPSKVREYQGLKSISQTTGNLDTTRQNQARKQAHIERIVTRQLQVKGPQTTSQTAGNFTGIRRPNPSRTQAPTSTKFNSEPQPSETVTIDLDVDETVEYLEERLDIDIETAEEVVLHDNEKNEDDNRVTNEDDDRLDDRDDDVLDEDYLVDEDHLSENDESDEDTIGNLARKGVQRKIDAKQTLPMRGPAKSIIVEDDLSDEDPIVNIAGRGVKRKADAEETSPVPQHGSMAQELPSKAVVQVRPLSSLEIRNWTAYRKRQRKY